MKLIDFGIAKAMEREDTTNVYRETLSGTLSYMSPEAIMDTSTNAKGVRVNKCGRVSEVVVAKNNYLIEGMFAHTNTTNPMILGLII